MDKYEIMKEIEKLNKEDVEELNYWLSKKLSDMLWIDFKKTIRSSHK